MSLKRTLLVLLVAVVGLSLFLACPAPVEKPGDMKGKLLLWSFTDEVQKMIPYFKKVYPNVEVESVIIPMADESYPTKVQQTIRAGEGGPDVFTGEIQYVRKFIEEGFFEDLSVAPYNAEQYAPDLMKYQVDLSRDAAGHIRGISWQATPGGIFYRRSVMKDTIGTDDPAEVGKRLSTWDGLFELAKQVKDKSKGKIKLFADYGDLGQFPMNARKQKYVENGKLVLEQCMIDFMDVAKKLRDQDLTAKVGTWSPPWFAGMQNKSIAGYILPTWGLHYVLKPNAEPEAAKGEKEFSGDWALTNGPASYFWGGTWMGVSTKSKVKPLAWEFVKFCTTNGDFLKEWAKTTGDFLGNQKIVDEIAPTFSEKFLGGQNHYAYFKAEASKINGSTVGPYDQQIQSAWWDQFSLFIEGKKDKATAIADFKKKVKSILPDVSVE